MSAITQNQENRREFGRNAKALLIADLSHTQCAPDIFNEDCRRQRMVGEEILRIANHEASATIAQSISEYLVHDHVRRRRLDDEVFFPFLQEHCFPEDNIAVMIGGLADAGTGDAVSIDAAAALLGIAAQGRRLNVDDARFLTAFAKQMINRAAILKAALFSIARVRFDYAALRSLCDALRALYDDTGTTTKNIRGAQ